MTATPTAAGDTLARDRADARLLRFGVAFVWIATGLLVVHPLYRSIGAAYLLRLGLPEWLMVATCALEVALGVRVALGPATEWWTLLQASMVATFTALLAVVDPWLLVSPFGMLTKNLPFVAAVVAAWLLEREGATPRARWLVRGGAAMVWITEGLFPKLLFQQASELGIAEQMGVAAGRPELFVGALGVAQLASGVAVLALRGRLRRLVLSCQLVGLVTLPLFVTWFVPWLWVHPFGPLTKNAPLLACTWLLLRRDADWA
ncbi:MAG: DoxX-like family protein [Polyangiaceae bacterium]|nr:DoxX-like family protein [Polyangiaceae bacterium]